MFALAVTICVVRASPQAAETTKLIYALPASVPAAVAYVAIDREFFKQEGLEVEPKMFSSGRQALQALLAGQAQIQSVSETPVVHAIVQGNKLATIATIARHGEAKLIARKDRGIFKPGDLRGRKIATLPGTNSDYFMYRLLKRHGIKPEEVKIANMSPPEMVVAYAKGDIDGYFAWEPHIYYGRRYHGERSTVFPPAGLYEGRVTVNMAPDFLAARPEAARRVIRALLKARDFMGRHPDEAARIVASRLAMDAKVLRDLMRENVYAVELDGGLPRLMTEVGAWVLEQNRSDKPMPDFRRYIDATALMKERPSAVSLE